MAMIKDDIHNAKVRPGDEIGMEERIKSGEEIEVTEAIRILDMIKDNIPFEEISRITGRTISDIEELRDIIIKK